MTDFWRNRIIERRFMKPGELQDHPSQWREHPRSQADALRGLLGEVGIVDSLKAYYSERAGGLVTWDGHLRKSLDPDQEWPVDITDLTDAEADLVLATFDPISALAEANRDKLNELLQGIDTSEPELLAMLNSVARKAGIHLEKFQPIDDPGPQIDKASDLLEKWQVRAGQVWTIPSRNAAGLSHRLMCGDSTCRADVERLVNGERAVLFATDPPYLVDYDGTNHPHKWSEPDANKDWSAHYHDWDDAEQGDGLYDGFISVAIDVAIVEDAAWYCWHASRNQAMVEQVWARHGAFVHQQIIWVKERPILTRSWYMWQHEPCFFGWIRGKKPKRVVSDFPPSVWHIQTVDSDQHVEHPTQKPIEVFTIPMLQHTEPSELCYEPFSGSGSQLVAAESIGRVCYAMEKMPEFVAVTLERLKGIGLEPFCDKDFVQ